VITGAPGEGGPKPSLRLAALYVPRLPPQYPLKLLRRQPANEPSPRVLLGSLDERLTEALVQAGGAVLIGLGEVPVCFVHLRRACQP
jgi:hypothetical protein